jgi:hypothetical protein
MHLGDLLERAYHCHWRLSVLLIRKLPNLSKSDLHRTLAKVYAFHSQHQREGVLSLASVCKPWQIFERKFITNISVLFFCTGSVRICKAAATL